MSKAKKKKSDFPFGKVVVVPVLLLVSALFAWRGMQGILHPAGLTNQLSARPSVDQLRNGDYEKINEDAPGQRLDLANYAVKGKYTIFDFSSVY